MCIRTGIWTKVPFKETEALGASVTADIVTRISIRLLGKEVRLGSENVHLSLKLIYTSVLDTGRWSDFLILFFIFISRACFFLHCITQPQLWAGILNCKSFLIPEALRT